MATENNLKYQQLICSLIRITGKGRTGLASLRTAMTPKKTGFSLDECNDIRELIDNLLDNMQYGVLITARNIDRKIKFWLDWKTTKCNSVTKIIEAIADDKSPYSKFVITYTRKKNANADKRYSGPKTVYAFEENVALTIYNKDGTTASGGSSGTNHMDPCSYACNEYMGNFKVVARAMEARALKQITAREEEFTIQRNGNRHVGICI